MWIFLAFISVVMQGFVNYIDEFLTNNNKLPSETNVHTKIGGLVLISTLMSFVGALVISFIPHDNNISNSAILLSLLSAVPMVAMYISYFYMLTIYPVHQVNPLFQISTLWLLFIEILFGGTISSMGLIGILVMIYGAYILDSGSLKWKIPTKMLLFAVPATSTWAIALYMVRMASTQGSPIAVSFWQLIGVGILGVILFFAVKSYREGFLFRIKNQGKVFLGLSFVNESLAEGSFLFGNMAVAIAPVAAYITAMGGVQSIFVMLLFVLFPQGPRSKISKIQWLAVFLISVGLAIIEYFH